jgi:signal peptidase II
MSQSPAPNYRWLLIPLGFIVLGLDLISKYWALAALAPDPTLRVVVIPGFLDFRIAYNSGGAFSLFHGNVFFVTALSIFCMGVLVWWAASIPTRYPLPWIGLGLVAGGAIGNLHDRLRWQHVVDFIHAYVVVGNREYAWPTFNIADSGIVVGIGLLLVLGLSTKQLDPPTPSAGDQTVSTPLAVPQESPHPESQS